MTGTNETCDRHLQMLLGQANLILTGASDAALRAQFFQALQDFFDNSNSWQEAISFTVIPNLLDYELVPISGRIMRLVETTDQNNTPQAAVMLKPGWVRFLYPYSNPQNMISVVAKNVTDPLECFPPDFPDWILPQYGLGIMDGVIGKMMAQPNQNWSDQKAAVYHLQRFRDAYCHARVATRYANKVGAQAWTYPQTYKTRSQKGGVSTFNVHPPSVDR